MSRVVVFIYNFLAYVILFSVVLYGVCFMGNVWLTQSIDARPQMPLVPALLIDGTLLFLVILFKTARTTAGFKSFWNKYVPTAIEGSTNILLSSLLAALILWNWQPIGRVVWEISNEMVKTIVRIVYIDGWVVILVGYLLNQRKDLFGLRQYWFNFRNRPFRKSGFRSFFLHKIIRHPIYLGMLICLWSAPTMTVSHLFFAMLMTLYVITVFQMEERNLTINYPNRGQRRRAY